MESDTEDYGSNSLNCDYIISSTGEEKQLKGNLSSIPKGGSDICQFAYDWCTYIYLPWSELYEIKENYVMQLNISKV